jgi:hypothetical protein
MHGETFIRHYSLLISFVCLFIYCYRIFIFSSFISSFVLLPVPSLLFIPIRIKIFRGFPRFLQANVALHTLPNSLFTYQPTIRRCIY